MGGEFSFSSSFFVGTENETDAALFGGFISAVDQFKSCILRDVNLPGVCDRSPFGIVVTVTRSAPAVGRVLVDFTTDTITAYDAAGKVVHTLKIPDQPARVAGAVADAVSRL